MRIYPIILFAFTLLSSSIASATVDYCEDRSPAPPLNARLENSTSIGSYPRPSFPLEVKGYVLSSISLLYGESDKTDKESFMPLPELVTKLQWENIQGRAYLRFDVLRNTARYTDFLISYSEGACAPRYYCKLRRDVSRYVLTCKEYGT
jgi:hypothetical protein